MSYRIVIHPPADTDLDRLPPPVRNLAEQELRRLARSPVENSRPSHFPYPPDYQQFPFAVEFEGDTYFCVALFRYGADETTLHIAQVAIALP